MNQEEVSGIALDWALEEGWNPGLHDAACFYAAAPKGFLVGLLDDEPVACISAVAYDPNFGFIGFYIVKPKYRGKGYGLKIWNAAMAKLQDRNVGLDGVMEQQANYKKSGFKLAYSNIRYEGTAKPTSESTVGVIPLSKVAVADLSQYDTRLFPASRLPFLKCWMKQPESTGFAGLQDGKIAGYSVIRTCRTGYKIGPLFADSQHLAKKLFQASCNYVEPGTKIYLDTPEVNQAAIHLAESYGMKKVFGTARMYSRNEPDIDLKKVFGVTTFELG